VAGSSRIFTQTAQEGARPRGFVGFGETGQGDGGRGAVAMTDWPAPAKKDKIISGHRVICHGWRAHRPITPIRNGPEIRIRESVACSFLKA
jgi:hypothetical protein